MTFAPSETVAAVGDCAHRIDLETDYGADYQMDARVNDITYKVIGAAMKVHNAFGPGLKEAHYQRALSQELEKAGLSFVPEQAVEVHLDGAQIGLLFIDHLVEGDVIVELKAVAHEMTTDEVAQVITYLCATGMKVGLLINFGRRSLEYRRILPPRNFDRWRERIHRYVWLPRGAKSANPLSNPLPNHPFKGASVTLTPGVREPL